MVYRESAYMKDLPYSSFRAVNQVPLLRQKIKQVALGSSNNS